MTLGAHPRPLERRFATTARDFAGDFPRASHGRRPKVGSCTYRGPQSTVRSSSNIASRTRRPDLTHQLKQFGLGIWQQINEGQRESQEVNCGSRAASS